MATKRKNLRLQLIKKADEVFSQWVRLSNSNFDIAMCVTCGVEKPWKELQNGHYISRACMNLRYDERNCHVQCSGCNVFKSGNYPKYSLWMIKEYGPSILDELDIESKKLKKWTVSELEDLIAEYKAKIDALTE